MNSPAPTVPWAFSQPASPAEPTAQIDQPAAQPEIIPATVPEPLVNGWDAAFCPDPAPTLIDGRPQAYAGFYLGGSSAFHTWNMMEKCILRHSGLVAMPIWVPTPGYENPRQVGLQVVAALEELHIPANANPWRVVMWDMETGKEPDGGWLNLAADTVANHGYGSLVYGSVDGSVLFSYPPRTGYMVAHYDGIPQLYPHVDTVGKQYAADVAVPNGRVDLNVIRRSLLAHLAPLP